jgi:hypothetical protein
MVQGATMYGLGGATVAAANGSFGKSAASDENSDSCPCARAEELIKQSSAIGIERLMGMTWPPWTPNDQGSGAPGVRRNPAMSNHGQPGVPCKPLLGAKHRPYE